MSEAVYGAASGLDRVGIESDIVEILADRAVARARLRIDNSQSRSSPFPDGDWLKVAVSARLYDPRDAERGGFDLPLAEGIEIEATARTNPWTVVDLALPPVLRREYAMAAIVFSADARYRKKFDPSNCRLVRLTYGELVRIDRAVLEDIYLRGGYGNPLTEEELKKQVRAGMVVATDGERLLRATEANGKLHLEPIGP
jgi:hypothetical protein